VYVNQLVVSVITPEADVTQTTKETEEDEFHTVSNMSPVKFSQKSNQ